MVKFICWLLIQQHIDKVPCRLIHSDEQDTKTSDNNSLTLIYFYIQDGRSSCVTSFLSPSTSLCTCYQTYFLPNHDEYFPSNQSQRRVTKRKHKCGITFRSILCFHFRHFRFVHWLQIFKCIS